MKSTLFKIIFISVIMVLVKIAFDIYKGIANPIHYNPNLLVFYLMIGFTFCLVFVFIRNGALGKPCIVKGLLWGALISLLWFASLVDLGYLELTDFEMLFSEGAMFLIGGILAGMLLNATNHLPYSRATNHSSVRHIVHVLVLALLFSLLRVGLYYLGVVKAYHDYQVINFIQNTLFIGLVSAMIFVFIRKAIPFQGIVLKGIWYTVFVFFIFYFSANLLLILQGIDTPGLVNIKIAVDFTQVLLTIIVGSYLFPEDSIMQRTYRIRDF